MPRRGLVEGDNVHLTGLRRLAEEVVVTLENSPLGRVGKVVSQPQYLHDFGTRQTWRRLNGRSEPPVASARRAQGRTRLPVLSRGAHMRNHRAELSIGRTRYLSDLLQDHLHRPHSRLEPFDD